MCLATLSGQVPVIGLVGRYPTNYLMGREPIPRRQLGDPEASLYTLPMRVVRLWGISPPFGGLSPSLG